MARKGYPDSKGDFRPKQSILPGNFSGFKEKVLSVAKLVVGIALLPLVYSSSAAFVNQISMIHKSSQNFFWLGALVFLIFFIFIWEPEIIYTGGHRLLEVIFSFFEPFVKVAPYLLPIYTIIIFMVYGLLSLGIKDSWLLEYCMFLSGFSIMMHIVFTSRALGSKKGDFLKANYIFGFTLIYVINIMLIAILFGLVFKEFSFVGFSEYSFATAKDIFVSLFKQVFVR